MNGRRRTAWDLEFIGSTTLGTPKTVLGLDPGRVGGEWRFLSRARETRTGELFYVWVNDRKQYCARPISRYWGVTSPAGPPLPTATTGRHHNGQHPTPAH